MGHRRGRRLQVGMLAVALVATGGWAPAPVDPPVPATDLEDLVAAVPATVAATLDGLPVLTDGPVAEALAAVGLVGSGVVEVPPTSAVAFTLPEGLDAVWVRADGPGGPTPWTPLALVDPADGPDGAGAAVRRVTELAWVRAADRLELAAPAGVDLDQVQVHLTDTLGLRAAGGAIDDVLAALDDPVAEVGTLLGDLLRPLGDPGAPGPSTSPTPRRASSARPAMSRRAEWGAAAPRSRHATARPRAVVVHHTATRNDYAKRESPAIVRAIQHHHQRTMGWSDVGYNVLIDRYGQVFEGRAGGIEAGVVGAHARGYNTGTVGVAMIGNYEQAKPTRSLLDRLADVTAWQARVHGIDLRADARTTVSGRRLRTFLGHRDVGQTACPGGYAVRKLPEVRAAAADARR